MSRVIEEHAIYVGDTRRLAALTHAIEETVRPGDVVLDLGTGTGILSVLAMRAGAARVYAIESGAIIELAREVARTNGFQDRIVFLRGHSTQVELPERVDAVVGDMIGRFGFDYGLLEAHCDLRARFLKPSSRVIPIWVDVQIMAIESVEAWESVELWGRSPAGVDLRPVRAIATNVEYPYRVRKKHLLSRVATLARLEIATAEEEPIRSEVCLEVERAGTFHGLAGGFRAQLSPNVEITNSPLSDERLDRANTYFPVDRPVEVEPGDLIQLGIHIVPRSRAVTWRVVVRGGPGAAEPGVEKARFNHSTLCGTPISQEDLRRTRPQFTPALSAHGAARLTVLRLCSGRTPLHEIEQETLRRHSDLFASLDQAASFVAGVVENNAV